MQSNPYQPPGSNVADRDLGPGMEVTWRHAVKVWWSIIWRLLLFTALGGMLAGGIAGGILGALGVPPPTIALVGSWLGILVSIPVGIWVVRWVLRKSWSDFRIVLVPVSK